MTIAISPHDPEERVRTFLAAADILSEEAGATSIDVRLASLRAFLYLSLCEFTDADGSVSTEVFGKLRAIVMRTVTEELDCMCDSSVVRKRPTAPVLRLIVGKQKPARAVINR